MAHPDPAVATVLHDSELHAESPSVWRHAARVGAIFGVVAIYLAVIGLLVMLHGRFIIVDVLSLGQAALVAIALGAGIMGAPKRGNASTATRLLTGTLAAAIAGAMLSALAVLMATVDLRWMFIALSPALQKLLTFGLPILPGIVILTLIAAVLGAIGVLLAGTPPLIRRAIIAGASAVVIAGVFQELIQIMLQATETIDKIRELFYNWDGLEWTGALAIFLIFAAISLLWAQLIPRVAPAIGQAAIRRRRAFGMLAMLVALIIFPLLAGSYIGQVLMLVGLYILMGMGLNLEVGLAGLLDLGFVAFFAVGAYTTALLTADNPHALAALSFWEAMPIAVMLSIAVGVLFGLPVLGVRGDYLAVATMGLGEIVRVIVASDFAAPLLGGAQGVLQIPRPSIAGHALADPVQLFYLTLTAAMIAAYIAWRLENSRLGRAWMALRDDEDVAQALGINLVRVKLLAYGLGAAFAGLSGSIFATMLGSVYPSSFQLVISINVLALIIVGGMGSLPGVIVGAAALIGLPELLREFGEYRYLMYGAALIIMMRIRPEGLWPSPTRRRELHSDDAIVEQSV